MSFWPAAFHDGLVEGASTAAAKEILAAGCREKGRACELFMRAAGGEIADELGEIVAEGAPSAGAELETHVLQKSLCAELTEACPEAHVFRRQPDALDVEFANRAGVALEVYWVKDGAPADAKPDELTVALGDGQSSTHDSYPRHRWAFLRPDDPWEHAGRLDLPARPQEQRYVITANGGFDPEMQATIVDPSAVSAEPVATRRKRHVGANEAKASNLHDEIKLRVTNEDGQAAPRKVLDVCKVGALSDALESLLGQAVVALLPDDEGSMMVRLHFKDVALLQTLNGLFLRCERGS